MLSKYISILLTILSIMKHLITSFVLLCVASLNLTSVANDSIAYYHYDTDTALIAKIIHDTRKAELQSPADRLVFIARQFINSPYKSATLEGDTELLRINLSEFDCTTLVETAIALAQTVAIDTASIDDFTTNLRNIRYRGGNIDGYASRLHYVSDWIADNAERGNFIEATPQMPGATRNVKTINYISTHHFSYPALSNNDSLLSCIKEVEKQYLNYNFYYIPTQKLSITPVLSALKNGDIVLFTTSTHGLDVSHMGIIAIEHGQPMLIHASSNERRVVFDQHTLVNYIRSNKKVNGIRIVRL